MFEMKYSEHILLSENIEFEKSKYMKCFIKKDDSFEMSFMITFHVLHMVHKGCYR